MSLQIVNGTTVVKFLEDGKAFDADVKECFNKIDGDDDGLLSTNELELGFHKLLALECETRPQEEITKLYQTILERFDKDGNGRIDIDEFRCLMMEIMLALARGIGDSPVLMALDVNSLLMKAVEHEHQDIHKNKLISISMF